MTGMVVSGRSGEGWVVSGGVRFHRTLLLRVCYVERHGKVAGEGMIWRTGAADRFALSPADRLFRGEALGDHGEEILVGTGTRQTEADAPGVAPDDGTDL